MDASGLAVNAFRDAAVIAGQARIRAAKVLIKSLSVP